MGWFEAGIIHRLSRPESLPGLSRRCFLSRKLSAHRWLPTQRAGSSKPLADSVFVSRFDNDLLNYSQTLIGFSSTSSRAFDVQSFWSTNVTVDVKRQYWANFVETGPGFRFHPPAAARIDVGLGRASSAVFIWSTQAIRFGPNFIRFPCWCLVCIHEIASPDLCSCLSHWRRLLRRRNVRRIWDRNPARGPRSSRRSDISPCQPAPADIFVAPPNTPASADWKSAGRTRRGPDSRRRIAARRQFRIIAASTETVSVVHLVDIHDPSLPVIWEKAMELPRFEMPADARVFAKDRWTRRAADRRLAHAARARCSGSRRSLARTATSVSPT